LAADDVKSLKDACEQQSREAKRIARLLEASVADLKAAATALGKKK
jgi:hypothetical protein